jgi:hypothetical protein
MIHNLVPANSINDALEKLAPISVRDLASRDLQPFRKMP